MVQEPQIPCNQQADPGSKNINSFFTENITLVIQVILAVPYHTSKYVYKIESLLVCLNNLTLLVPGGIFCLLYSSNSFCPELRMFLSI